MAVLLVTVPGFTQITRTTSKYNHVYYNSDKELSHATLAAYDTASVVFSKTTTGEFELTIYDDDGNVTTYIDSTGNVGIKTSAPDADLEINNASGGTIRLTYNDSDGSAANYAEIATTNNGDLTYTMSGADKWHPAINIFSLVSATSSRPQLILQNTNTNSLAPQIAFQKFPTGSAADDDDIANWWFYGYDTGNNQTTYANVRFESEEVTDGDEAGSITFFLSHDDGTINTDNFLELNADAGSGAARVVINEDSKDIDFIVESDGMTDLIWTDGANDRVGIGTSTPTNLVEIEQDAAATALYIDHNATTGRSIWIDAVTEGSSIIQVDANSLTSGDILHAYSNSADATVRKLVFIENDNASATGTAPLYVQQDAAYTAFWLEVNAANNGIYIDHNANGQSISIDAENTSANTFYIAADALTTGELMTLYSNSSDPSARSLLFVDNNNIASTNTDAVFIQQSGPQRGLVVYSDIGALATDPLVFIQADSSGFDEEVVYIQNDGVESGLWVYSNTDNAASAPLVHIQADNAAYDHWPLFVTNDGTNYTAFLQSVGSGATLFIDTDGNAASLNIDGEQTTVNAVVMQFDALTSGEGLTLASNSGSNSARYLQYNYNQNVGAEGTIGLMVEQGSTHHAAWFYTNIGAQADQPLVYMRSDSTAHDQPVLTVQQDGTGIGINVDHNGNSNALYVDAENTTTSSIVAYADVATTGGVAYLYSNSSDNSARYLVSMINDHASADAAEVLYIKQDGNDWAVRINSTDGGGIQVDHDGNNNALYIDGEETTANVIAVYADALTTGHLAYLYSNSSSSSTRTLVNIINDHADADATTVLNVRQDAEHYGAYFDMNGDAQAIFVESEATNYNGVYVEGKYPIGVVQDISNGYGLKVYRNLNEAGSEALFQVNDDHTANTQIAASIKQDGAAVGVFVDMNNASAGYGINLDSESTSNSALLIQGKYNIYANSDIAGGYAATFTRNLSGAQTNPVVIINEEHASSSAQGVLQIRQDGTGFILEAWDAGSLAFDLHDGGYFGIGNGALNGILMYSTATISRAGNVASLWFTNTMTTTGNASGAYGMYIDPTTTINHASTHPIVATAFLAEPGITVSAGTVTTAATLYIANAPTEGATNNNAIYVAGGESYFGGNVGIGITDPTQELEVYHATAGDIQITTGTSGSGALLFNDGAVMGYLKYNHSTNEMTMRANGSERFLWNGNPSFIVSREATIAGTDSSVKIQVDGNGDGRIDLFADDGDNINIYDNGTYSYLTTSGNVWYINGGGTVYFDDVIGPWGDNAHDVGSPTNNWNDGFFEGSLGTSAEAAISWTDSCARMYISSGHGRLNLEAADGDEVSIWNDGVYGYITANNLLYFNSSARSYFADHVEPYADEGTYDFGGPDNRWGYGYFWDIVGTSNEKTTAWNDSCAYLDVTSGRGYLIVRAGDGDNLQVYHDGTNANLYATAGPLRSVANDTTNADHLLLQSISGENRFKFYYEGDGDANLAMYAPTDELNIRFDVQGNSYLLGGNFGIGTTTPDHDLEVTETGSSNSYQAANAADVMSLTRDAGGNMDLRSSNNVSSGILWSDPEARAEGILRYDHSNNTMDFFTNGAEAMTIDSLKRVGFNTGGATQTYGIELDVADTDNRGGMLIDMNETGSYYGLYIDTESTATYGAYISGKYGLQVVTTESDGTAIRAYNNTSDAGSAPLVEFHNGYASYNQEVLKVQQDGINRALYVYTNVGATVNTSLVYFHSDNTGHDQAVNAIVQDGVGAGLTVTTNSTSASNVVWLYGSSNSAATLYAASHGTADVIQLFDGATEVFSIADGGVPTFTQAYGHDMNGETIRDMQINNSGELGYDSGSRMEWKTNIEPIDASFLYNINAFQFNYKDKDEDGNYIDGTATDIVEYGFDVREVASYIPYKTNLIFRDEENEPMGFNYKKFVPILVQAMQDQDDKIKEQDKKIESLEERLTRLENLITK